MPISQARAAFTDVKYIDQLSGNRLARRGLHHFFVRISFIARLFAEQLGEARVFWPVYSNGRLDGYSFEPSICGRLISLTG